MRSHSSSASASTQGSVAPSSGWLTPAHSSSAFEHELNSISYTRIQYAPTSPHLHPTAALGRVAPATPLPFDFSSSGILKSADPFEMAIGDFRIQRGGASLRAGSTAALGRVAPAPHLPFESSSPGLSEPTNAFDLALGKPFAGPSESPLAASEAKARSFPLPFELSEAQRFEIHTESAHGRCNRLLHLHGGKAIRGDSGWAHDETSSLHNIWCSLFYDGPVCGLIVHLIPCKQDDKYELPFIDVLACESPRLTHARFVVCYQPDAILSGINPDLQKRYQRSRLPHNWKEVHHSTLKELAQNFVSAMNLTPITGLFVHAGPPLMTITPPMLKMARAVWQYFEAEGVVAEYEGRMCVLCDKVNFPDIGFLSALAIFLEAFENREQSGGDANQWLDDASFNIWTAVQLLRKLVARKITTSDLH